MIITYTPTRMIVGGGGVINTTAEASDFDQKAVGREFESLDGTRVQTLNHIRLKWRIACDLKDSNEIEFFREFAASCANGETFTVDFEGIPGTPTTVDTYQLERNTYKDGRITGQYFKPSFTITRVL